MPETLPAACYTDPATLEAEHRHVFARAWHYVVAAEQVAAPGSFAAGAAGRVPVVVVRDGDGVLRAFVNVCRHRGHVVAHGAGRCSTLQCPYHAWTYALDGTLRAVPRADREPDFDAGGLDLRPVAVDTWGPLVFVNPDPAAEPLAAALGELPDVVAASGLDLGALRHVRRTTWSLEANWKVAVENYLECYHCQVAHPRLAELFDVRADAYGLHTGERCSWQIGPKRDRRPAATFVDRGAIAAAQWHWLWPNATVNVEAGPPNLSVDVFAPDGPQRTSGFTDYFFGADVPAEVAEEIMAFSAQVGAEDAALVASVQRGLASGMVEHGRLLPRSERLIAHFQELIRAALAADVATG